MFAFLISKGPLYGFGGCEIKAAQEWRAKIEGDASLSMGLLQGDRWVPQEMVR